VGGSSTTGRSYGSPVWRLLLLLLFRGLRLDDGSGCGGQSWRSKDAFADNITINVEGKGLRDMDRAERDGKCTDDGR